MTRMMELLACIIVFVTVALSTGCQTTGSQRLQASKQGPPGSALAGFVSQESRMPTVPGSTDTRFQPTEVARGFWSTECAGECPEDTEVTAD